MYMNIEPAQTINDMLNTPQGLPLVFIDPSASANYDIRPPITV